MWIAFYSLPLLVTTIWLTYRVNHVKKHIKNYKLPIKNNAILYYLFIILALILSKYISDQINIGNFIFWYLILFIIHEVQWYLFHTQILKDEIESTEDFFSWCNHLNDGIVDTSAKVENDYSEGIFNGDFSIPNHQAMQNKYDLYYDYLKLKKGMKVLDIGCGNGHWAYYLKQRGVFVTGIVNSKDHYEECKKKGITVLLGDARIIMKDMKERFDAISAIGSIEHFSSLSQPKKIRIETLKNYYKNVINLIDLNSSSKRYLNSIMTINLASSKYRTLEYFFHFYLTASAFGSGYYPSSAEIESIYNSKQSKIIVKRDYTEDYRYIFIRNSQTIGNFNWLFNTPKRIMFLLKAILIDPYWVHKILFGLANSWSWSFGGNSKKPMPENTDTPIRAYIYVAEIT